MVFVTVSAALHCLSKTVTGTDVDSVLLQTVVDTGSLESYLIGDHSEISP